MFASVQRGPSSVFSVPYQTAHVLPLSNRLCTAVQAVLARKIRRYPRALRVPLKLTPRDVKSFFLFPKTPGWSCDVTVYTCTRARAGRVCACGLVFKGLELSAKTYYCTRPVLLHTTLRRCYYYTIRRQWLSLRARAPGATTLLLRIFVGKLPRRPVVSKERKRKRGGMAASCALTTARWFCFVFFQGWARGHVCSKVPNPNLGSFATICPSLIELPVDSQQPSILSLINNRFFCKIPCKINALIIE